MQSIRSVPLTAFQASELLGIWTDLLDDTDVKTVITLKSLKSQVVNVESGSVTRTSDDDTVDAIRRTVKAQEVTRGGTQLEPNDRIYQVLQSDLTNEIQTVDRIVEGTEVFGVIEFEADPLDWVWQFVARLT